MGPLPALYLAPDSWHSHRPIVTLHSHSHRLKYSNVPDGLKGLGITFLITGLMGLGFMSFMGIKVGNETEDESPIPGDKKETTEVVVPRQDNQITTDN